jgi:hypothetical protein
MRSTLIVGALVLAGGMVEAQTPLVFIPLPEPCRLVDSRDLVSYPAGPLVPGEVRPIDSNDACGLPREAKGLLVNLTVTNAKGAGYLSVLRPGGRTSPAPIPTSSVLNFTEGQTVANSAFTFLGAPSGHSWDGSFWLLAGGAGADLIVDVSGYYLPAL